MQFRLTYDGPLYSSQSKQKGRAQVHEIRRAIHVQMKELWQQLPLSDHRDGWLSEFGPEQQGPGLGENRGPFRFVPLVSDRNHLHARLDVLLLRPAPPGHLINLGGDLDNRLKTFLDALRIPSISELPDAATPSEDERPFMCLLSDDKLVTAFSVDVDRLLVPNALEHDVMIVAKVSLAAVRHTWNNDGLVSMGLVG